MTQYNLKWTVSTRWHWGEGFGINQIWLFAPSVKSWRCALSTGARVLMPVPVGCMLLDHKWKQLSSKDGEPDEQSGLLEQAATLAL